jgi:serine/threonine kinase 16
LINEYNKKGEHLKEEYILSLFKQICFGIKTLVEYKNKQGIITPWAHRDIKPA